MEPSYDCKHRLEDNMPLFSLDLYQDGSKLSISQRNYIAAVDSGYGSSYNVTPYNTPNVSCNVASPSQRIGSGSANLNTIAEGSDSVKVTPVTQNILKFTQFHITTPQSSRSSKRRSTSAVNLKDFHSTPKRSKIDPELNGNTAPMQIVEYASCNVRRAHAQKKLFRRQLKSAPEFNGEQEDEFENVSVLKRSNLSPILTQDLYREKRIPLTDANINFLKSSTPKSHRYSSKHSAINFSTNFTSVERLLSFTDQELENLTKHASKFNSHILSRDGNSLLSPKTGTPHKEILSFKENLSELSNSSDCKPDIYQEDSFRMYKKVYPIINSIFKDGENIKRHSTEIIHANLKSTPKSKSRESYLSCRATDDEFQKFKNKAEPIKIAGFHDILNIVPPCADVEIISLEKSLPTPSLELEWTFEISSKYNNSKTDREIDEVNSINKSDLRSSSLEKESKRVSLDERVDNIPKTPKKQKLFSVNQERLDILYPTLPRTPSKKTHTQNSFKRKLETENQHEKRPRKFYDGITQLNIISKLESYSLVLDRIFELLSNEDLFNFVRVSKNWKKMVQQNSKANARLRKYLYDWDQSKENSDECKFIHKFQIKKDILCSCKKNEKSTRTPFSQSNTNEQKMSSYLHKSPPVSPSKRKFYENQKVVRTLTDNEKLIKCPRCSKSSRIITSGIHDLIRNERGDGTSSTLPVNNGVYLSKNLETFQAAWNISSDVNKSGISVSHPLYNTPRYKSKLKKSLSADLGIISTQKFQRRRLSSPIRSYAECSGVGCKFRFCLECFCEYHPETRCKLSEPISPSKEDLQNGVLQMNSASASRNFKSRRKSLKRLCF